MDSSCIPFVTDREPFLSGEGVIFAVIDSGIDYFLDEFKNDDGTTRIMTIVDQTTNSQYTRDQINEAISLGRPEGLQIVPQTDVSGHGTAVAAIGAGSITGVAKKADILAIKLGNPASDSFPRTTQLMRAITYAVNMGVSLNRPIVINLSFGNTYGDHRGESLLERFIDNASEIGKNVIVIGSGNEGASNGHTSGVALEEKTIELVVAPYERGLSVQLWKYINDRYDLIIESPGGERKTIYLEGNRIERITFEETLLLIYIGEPKPYSVNQEIYIEMQTVGDNRYINNGVWKFTIVPDEVVTGEYRFYLPSFAARNAGTGFLLPTPEVTLTIPSTSQRAITVGAYDDRLRSYADFSGRGYVYRYLEGQQTGGIPSIGIAFNKPDLVAPGVDIRVPVTEGGYENVSGTSFATPFVSGAAALLMEYGIVRGNDPYLYGQKLKSHLTSSTTKLPGEEFWPNARSGWGALCVKI